MYVVHVPRWGAVLCIRSSVEKRTRRGKIIVATQVIFHVTLSALIYHYVPLYSCARQLLLLNASTIDACKQSGIVA